MANRAFVLVETAVGMTREVAGALRVTDGVQSVDVVTGPYDIVAVVNSPDIGAMGSLVTEKMHSVVGLLRTVTCVAVTGN